MLAEGMGQRAEGVRRRVDVWMRLNRTADVGSRKSGRRAERETEKRTQRLDTSNGNPIQLGWKLEDGNDLLLSAPAGN